MQMTLQKQMVDVEHIRDILASKIDSAGFTSWIAPLKFEVKESCLNVYAHNQFVADYITNVYFNCLNEVAATFSLSLHICIANKISSCDMNIANDNTVNINNEKLGIKKSYNEFDKFIVSDDNMFALAACKKIALGNASFNQLFIHGPSGCGKTMLLNCINLEFSGRVVMLSGDQFVSNFTSSLRDKTVFKFKDFCRECDVFILDDICALSGKNATINEFVQLISDLRNSGKYVIISSSVAPTDLIGFDHRIQSLLSSGLVVNVVAPNVCVRKNMLIKSGMSREIADVLSKNLIEDGHVITGVVNKLKTYSELMGEKINLDIAMHLVRDVLQKKSNTPTSYVKSMAEKMGISYEDICSNSRIRRVTRARQIIMLALKKATNLSLTEIGNVCGGRDHATVVYSISQIEKQMSGDLILSAEINDLINICR